MRRYLHWRLTPSLRTFRVFSTACAWPSKKSSSPANEIRREEDERLLKIDGQDVRLKALVQI